MSEPVGFPDLMLFCSLWLIPFILFEAFGAIFITENSLKRVANAMESGEYGQYMPLSTKTSTFVYNLSGMFGMVGCLLLLFFIVIADIINYLPPIIDIIIIFISCIFQCLAGSKIIKFKKLLPAGLDNGKIKLTGWWKVVLLEIPIQLLRVVLVVGITTHIVLIIKLLLSF